MCCRPSVCFIVCLYNEFYNLVSVMTSTSWTMDSVSEVDHVSVVSWMVGCLSFSATVLANLY